MQAQLRVIRARAFGQLQLFQAGNRVDFKYGPVSNASWANLGPTTWAQGILICAR
jgi:hypothetical protein